MTPYGQDPINSEFKRLFLEKHGDALEIQAQTLLNPCNLCFEREGDPKLSLPIFEGKIVNPEVVEDYAYMPICRPCFEQAEADGRQEQQTGRRPATQIEVEAITALCDLQDVNQALTKRLAQITKEVEAVRQYAVANGLMIGECAAWSKLKRLTIYYQGEKKNETHHQSHHPDRTVGDPGPAGSQKK
ncbi:MAG: hypothetical protein KJ077_11335 [Anaerolineae bacterium]|nr:hypothetical protein [Anaerolineae bacterium]